MARAARMSRYHFSRRFKDATGKSPYRYLVDVRLERAAELLRRGRAGVTEAALTVGFSDPSRFARMFRARFGASPAKYAEARRPRVRVTSSAT
jgi:AraC family transcriptional regulator